MRVLRHPRGGGRGTALAIGSFDGVHLGHQALIAHTVQAARSLGLAAATLSFEPLPREHFAPLDAPARLTNLGERLHWMADHGVETAFVQRFDAAFAALTAQEFERRLAGEYGARWIMVGEDFRYGARRGGDLASLRVAGARHGFRVHVLPSVTHGGERVSSTRVRAALAQADFALAERLLGRRYAICGHVVHGAKRGRGLGFPTANVRLGRARPALHGIFAVKCYGAATRGLEGVASLGINPAVNDGGPATLEAFLFDFSGDLYGRRLTIEFRKKLREETHFASLDALAAQIRRDCDAAREHFRAP